MNPIVAYTFKSVTGKQEVIRSRMGEDSARSAAMAKFWGPPYGWCQNKGTGLTLVSTKQEDPVLPAESSLS